MVHETKITKSAYELNTSRSDHFLSPTITFSFYFFSSFFHPSQPFFCIRASQHLRAMVHETKITNLTSAVPITFSLQPSLSHTSTPDCPPPVISKLSTVLLAIIPNNPFLFYSLGLDSAYRPRGVAMAAASWSHTAMLVIDMQKDFILQGSPMHVAGGEAVVPSVIKAISVARNRGIFVIWVCREHDPFGRDVELFRRHLYADGKGPTTGGSQGAELVDGLIIEEGDYKLIKTRFSAFFATHLHSLLQSNGIKSLVIVGVQTPNCIRQTVFDAVALNYQPVTVIVDATAAATPQVHSANILDMKNIGVVTPTLEEWCSDNV